jgi:hypothetical protein
MTRCINDPLAPEVSEERRSQVQEDFGRHLVEERNRFAALVRKWIETDAKFPVPIYDRLLDRVRALDPPLRRDVASVALLMADEVVKGILEVFSRSDVTRAGHQVVNYAIVAQSRDPQSETVLDEVDVNRGRPVIPIWDEYKKWLSLYAPPDLRPRSGHGQAD